MRGKLPNAISDKMISNSGESDDAIGASNAHLRGHNKAGFTTFWWPGIACAADDLARAAAGKVAKHAEGKICRNLLEPLRLGRWGGPARDLLPNTSVPFS